jgi:hypothetical protein
MYEHRAAPPDLKRADVIDSVVEPVPRPPHVVKLKGASRTISTQVCMYLFSCIAQRSHSQHASSQAVSMLHLAALRMLPCARYFAGYLPIVPRSLCFGHMASGIRNIKVKEYDLLWVSTCRLRTLVKSG